MNKREQRIVDAFINCIMHGEFTEDYAITLIEDNSKYGWLSQTAKDAFYDRLEELHTVPEPVVEPIPEESVEQEEPTEETAETVEESAEEPMEETNEEEN